MQRRFNHMSKKLIAGWLLYSAMLIPINASATAKEWRFRVFLDDKEIGYHHFELTRAGEDEILTTQAQFNVTFLKIPLFRYQHSNVERWNGQCLKSIASTTSENRKRFRVEGAVKDEEFLITTATGDRVLPACISTFSYWNKSFLKRDQLLNSQTGEYLDVKVDYLGDHSIRVRDKSMYALQYQLTTDKNSIELWYSADDQWLALQSATRSGQVLRYVIE